MIRAELTREFLKDLGNEKVNQFITFIQNNERAKVDLSEESDWEILDYVDDIYAEMGAKNPDDVYLMEQKFYVAKLLDNREAMDSVLDALEKLCDELGINNELLGNRIPW